MASITIDGKDYEVDDLSDEAKKQLASLQFVQSELNKINGQIAVYKTAQVAYSSALKKILEGE